MDCFITNVLRYRMSAKSAGKACQAIKKKTAPCVRVSIMLMTRPLGRKAVFFFKRIK